MSAKINSLEVKSKRVKHQKTQNDMALLLGINNNTYCQKENGNAEFTLSEAKIIADALLEKIDELFFAQNRH